MYEDYYLFHLLILETFCYDVCDGTTPNWLVGAQQQNKYKDRKNLYKFVFCIFV